MELHQIVGRDRRHQIIRKIDAIHYNIGALVEAARDAKAPGLPYMGGHLAQIDRLRAEYDPMCDPTSNGDLDRE